MGVIDLAPTCGSEPGVGEVRTAVVGSDRTSRVLDAGSGREDESSDLSLSEDKAAFTLIISVIQLERLISVDIVPHRNK